MSEKQTPAGRAMDQRQATAWGQPQGSASGNRLCQDAAHDKQGRISRKIPFADAHEPEIIVHRKPADITPCRPRDPPLAGIVPERLPAFQGPGLFGCVPRKESPEKG